MSHEIPEAVKCPICLELPTKEIFQCRNGHAFCDICSKKLQQCPQCRLPFEIPRIRNRAMETLLDTMKFSCPYKLKGCGIQINRAEFPTHSNSCTFRGSSTKLCEYLGYFCEFVFHSRRFQDGIDHLVAEHGVLVCPQLDVQFKLEGISTIDRKSERLWTQVILQATPSVAFMVLSGFNKEHNTIALNCLQLSIDSDLPSSANGFEVNFVIKSSNTKETRDIQWTTSVIPLDNTEQSLRQPFFQFGMNMLEKEFQRDDAFVVKCSIRKGGYTKPESLDIDDLCLISYPAFEFEKMGRMPQHSKQAQEPNSSVSKVLGYLQGFQDPGTSNVPEVPETNATHVPSLFKNIRSWKNRYEKRTPTVEFVIPGCINCGKKSGCYYHCMECTDVDICPMCHIQGYHTSHKSRALIENIDQQNGLLEIIKSPTENKRICRLIEGWQFERQNFLKTCAGCGDQTSTHKYLCVHCAPPIGYCGRCFFDPEENHIKKHFLILL